MAMAMKRLIQMRERGMSLVEVLIALTILALALLGLMPLFVGAVKTVASSSQLTSANTLVREKLEELNGYPRDDLRLAVTVGSSASFGNDLPSGYNPKSGAVCGPDIKPPVTCPTLGAGGWYAYPYVRTYTVEQFAADLVTPVVTPASYTVKLVTVTVRPTQGPFPGLRQTTQSLYLRLPNG
jgi:prepilin-type N-terminal cleavage/methylation domain-containing protein